MVLEGIEEMPTLNFSYYKILAAYDVMKSGPCWQQSLHTNKNFHFYIHVVSVLLTSLCRSERLKRQAEEMFIQGSW